MERLAPVCAYEDHTSRLAQVLLLYISVEERQFVYVFAVTASMPSGEKTTFPTQLAEPTNSCGSSR